MRFRFTNLGGAWVLFIIATLLSIDVAISGEKISATVLVKDSLTAPNSPAVVEVKVTAKGLLGETPLGGEPIELLISGKVVATGMTGGDGKGRLSYTPRVQGIFPIYVRVGNSPRVGSASGEANLVVWERRSPILVVEVGAAKEEPSTRTPLSSLEEAAGRPMPDAVDELMKLTQFYYRALYAVPIAPGADDFVVNGEARDWLKRHNFPLGYVLCIPPGDDSLGEEIDELNKEGWKTIRTGIVRTRAFAEALLRRRLDAVIIPEPANGEVPRKAKTAKDWKEVRKKL
ncbi:hypothetical protein [Petrachloros mirabilis]